MFERFCFFTTSSHTTVHYLLSIFHIPCTLLVLLKKDVPNGKSYFSKPVKHPIYQQYCQVMPYPMCKLESLQVHWVLWLSQPLIMSRQIPLSRMGRFKIFDSNLDTHARSQARVRAQRKRKRDFIMPCQACQTCQTKCKFKEKHSMALDSKNVASNYKNCTPAHLLVA